MKKLFFVIAMLVTFVAGNQVIAQTIKAEDVTVKVDKVERPAISVTSEADIDAIQEAWASYLKKTYKVKVKTSKNEVMAEAASIPEISASIFDLNTIYKTTSGGSEMIVTAAAGYDIYYSPNEHGDDYRKLKTVVEEFVRMHVATQYDETIKNKQKEIDASIKDQENMQKEIAKLEKDIVEANETILKLQKQIEENSATLKTDKEALPGLAEAIEKHKALLTEMQAKKLKATGK